MVYWKCVAHDHDTYCCMFRCVCQYSVQYCLLDIYQSLYYRIPWCRRNPPMFSFPWYTLINMLISRMYKSAYDNNCTLDNFWSILPHFLYQHNVYISSYNIPTMTMSGQFHEQQDFCQAIFPFLSCVIDFHIFILVT